MRELERLEKVLKALGYSKRLVLFGLIGLVKEVSVSTLVEVTKFPQPTVSRLLSSLRNAGLISFSRDSTRVFYSLDAPREFSDLIDSILRMLQKDPNFTKLLDSLKKKLIEKPPQK